MEELQKKGEETARALKAVSAKNQELEARMHHLSASASSSEQELRSEAAEVAYKSLTAQRHQHNAGRKKRLSWFLMHQHC